MTATIRFGIFLLSLVCSCHMRQLCSSFFKFSYLKRPHVDSDSIAEYKADSELNCALRCNTRGNCDEATFNRESKKCSLYKMKDKATIGSNTRDDNSRSRTVTMSKVIIPRNKSNKDCPFTDDKKQKKTRAVQSKTQQRERNPCAQGVLEDDCNAAIKYQ
ncbi:uncharacterized protein LOC144645809 [Oculina patagonica]